MQQEYMEDKLGVLDIAKEVGHVYVNPFSAAAYSPSAWSPSRGGFRVGSGLWGDGKFAQKIRRDTKAGVKFGLEKATGKDMSVLKRHGRAKLSMGKAGSLANKMQSKDSVLSNIGMQYDDGYIKLSNTALKDTTFQKKMAGNIKQVYADIDQYKEHRSNILLEKWNVEKKLQPKHMKKKTRVRHTKALDNINAKLAKVESKIDLAKTGSTKKIAGYKALKAAHAGGRTALRGGMRLGMLAGKAHAVVAVGSLMWEGAKIIGNPVGVAAANAINNTFDTIQSFSNPEMGGKLNMDFLAHGAATERQRAIQAISRSRMNGRSAMGNEAQYMHA